MFNEAAQQVAQEEEHSLSENARALALINMAMSDSLVTSFLNKYHYNFWRPETAIQAAGDLSCVPFVVTPCFPSYPSNHGSAGNGGAEVLRRLYGEAGHSITLTNPAVPSIVLQYTSFKQITDDISDARVYGGIHFRADQEAGADLGRAVGTAVYKNNLRPAHDDSVIEAPPSASILVRLPNGEKARVVLKSSSHPGSDIAHASAQLRITTNTA